MLQFKQSKCDRVETGSDQSDLGPLLNFTYSLNGSRFGTKQSLNAIQILEVLLKLWMLPASRAPSFHTRRKEWRRKQTKQNKLYIFFCVKEVSISFGRKKTRFLAFRSTGDTMNIFTGDTYLLTLFMSDCPILLSNLISWHHFTDGYTSHWEAWRTSISNRCLDNEMPALLPVMPCQ